MRFRHSTLAIAGVTLALGASAFGANTGTVRAAVAPNGLIAYSSWDNQLHYDIYMVDPAQPDQPPVRLTTDGAFNSNPDWSPDGKHIAFDGWANFGGPRVQVMDTDPTTDDQVALTDPGNGYGDFQPAWSPNGTRIAFVSARPDPDGSDSSGYEIYVMDASGEVGALIPAARLTTDQADPDTGMSPEDSQVTWSPDGSRIAFLSTGRGVDPDSCDLWVMDSADRDGDGFGDDLSRLTFDESFNCDAFDDVSPQWSPNSNLIAFTSVRSGYFDIWTVNAADPSDLRNVTRTPDAAEDQPGWSPDGTRVIFRSSVSGQYEMYSLPVPPPASAMSSGFGIAAATLGGKPKPTQLTHDARNKQQADWGARRGALPSTSTLTVSRHGKGRVAGPGIDCGRDCVSTFVNGRLVSLTAIAASGYSFKGWRGACTGPQRTCTLRLGKQKSVTAIFVRSL